MNTCQLKCAIEKDEYMCKVVDGVFPRDKIPAMENGEYSFIFNTAPHNHAGLHWVAYFTSDTSIEIFDSFGYSPHRYKLPICQQGRKILYNGVQLQQNDTEYCGHYALLFLYLRCRNNSFDDILQNFSTDLMVNDLFAYNFVRTHFNICLTDVSLFNQSCLSLAECGMRQENI